MQGSLYWLVLRALAAIWLVRLGCLTLATPTGLGEEQGTGGATGPATPMLATPTSPAPAPWVVGKMPTLLTLGHRGELGTFLKQDDQIR